MGLFGRNFFRERRYQNLIACRNFAFSKYKVSKKFDSEPILVQCVKNLNSTFLFSFSSDFLGLMKKVSKSPKVMDILNIQGVQRSLERLADLLGKIQKALGEYLERERTSFPRFIHHFIALPYYLSFERKKNLIISCKNVSVGFILSATKICWRLLVIRKTLLVSKSTLRKCLPAYRLYC